MRKGAMSLAAVSGLAVVFAAWQLADTTAQEPGRSPRVAQRPVMSTHQLMGHFNRPIYEALGTAVSDQPIDFKAIEEHALAAAEVANLVMIRREVPQRGAQDWMMNAGRVQQAAIELAETAQTQNPQHVQQAANNLVQSCNACHQQFAPDRAPQLDLPAPAAATAQQPERPERR